MVISFSILNEVNEASLYAIIPPSLKPIILKVKDEELSFYFFGQERLLEFFCFNDFYRMDYAVNT